MAISSQLGSSALLPAGLGFRNVLINGDFKVWQRGTSKAMATGSGTGYLADRWTAARASYTSGGTVSRQTASLDGFQYCSRVQRDSGNPSTATAWYFQTLEAVTSIPLANKPVTYSFYIRSGSNFSGSIKALLYSGTGAEQNNFPDNAITGSTTIITSTLSLTTSWQRIVLYGNVPSTATQLFVGFGWTPSGTAGASDYFEITGVQLEQNTQPTPFEQRPIGVELALCQRYFVTHVFNVGGYSGFADSTTLFLCVGSFSPEMRIGPSLSPAPTASDFEVRRSGLTASSVTAISVNTTPDLLRLTVTSSSLTAGAGGIFTSSSGTKYLYWSAEL